MGRSLRSLLFLILSGSSIEGHAEDLLELYRRALETNPVLKGREYDVDRTSAQKNQAQSKLLPQLSAVGNRSWNDFDTRGIDSEQYYGKRGTIQGRQALFDLPSYRSLEAAEARNLQSKEELQAARMDVAGELVDRYLEVLGAADEITHLQAEREAAASQLGRLRRMYERQLAKVTDLYEVEAYYETLNAREIETQNSKAVALEKLRETAGVVVQEVAPLVRESFPAVPGIADEWVQDATRNNRNLVALQHAIESEQKTIARARAEHLPQVALVASETYADTAFDNRRNPPYNVGTIGVQVNVPLYEGGRVQAATQEAVARYQIAKERYEQKRREIAREIRTAYLSTVANRARIDATTQAVRAQEKTRDAQQKSYQLGVSTIVDLLDAERRLFRAREKRVALRSPKHAPR